MQKPVLIETSARHVHVSRRVLNILFGEGYELTHKKDLSQPGQFACEERVQVIGPKNSFPAVSILGPVRPETQVALSAGDLPAVEEALKILGIEDLAGRDIATLSDGQFQKACIATADFHWAVGILPPEVLQHKIIVAPDVLIVERLDQKIDTFAICSLREATSVPNLVAVFLAAGSKRI